MLGNEKIKANMNLLNIILIIVCVGLLSVTLYLFYNNRASEQIISKVIPAVTVGLVASLLTIFFNLKENQFNESFTAALIAHADRMTPLEQINHDYHRFYGGNISSARNYVKPIKGQTLHDYHFTLITTEIVELLFGTFQAFKENPDADMFSSSGYPKSLNLKRKFIAWENYVDILKNDSVLFDYLSQINPEVYQHHLMSLPRNTEIYYQSDNFTKEITLKNGFINFKISISKWKGERNLREWTWILGFKEEEQDEYWISYFIINTEVKTDKFKNGHPLMAKYEDWANTIVFRLKQKYDYNAQLKRAMEYSHYFGEKMTNKTN